MSWQTEWNALATRIEALVELSRVYATSGLQEHHGASNETLVPQGRAMFPLLQQFSERHGADLPRAASECLRVFLGRPHPFVPEGGVIGLQGGLYLVGLLAMLRAEVTYHSSDHDLLAVRRVDAAFTHLRRTLVVDEDVRKKWGQAFKSHETRCESLGAVHLLQHGIWAFKANAEGGRTDLILGEPPSLHEVRRASEALVLTEWKLVRENDRPEAKATEARTQAEQYAEGVLAGFELGSRRYLVLVSEQPLVALPAVAQSAKPNVSYEVVNIPVSPSVPSVVSSAVFRRVQRRTSSDGSTGKADASRRSRS